MSKSFPNLSPTERQAIRTLKEDKNLVIRPADKGGAIVLLDYAYYKQEILEQLTDTLTYRPLPCDPTPKFKRELDAILTVALNAGWIDKDTFLYMSSDYPRTPIIYTLPKIHKSLSAPPGRPIISAVGSLYQPVSTFIDYHLQPLVKSMPSYTQDSTHVILRLRELGEIPPDSILVTMDVKSLYTIIPHDMGIGATRRALLTDTSSRTPTEFLLQLLELTLTRNFFRFENSFFLQIAGTAMGSALAPSYANLFMLQYESEYIAPLMGDSILAYFRYIDDLFMIWTKGVDSLLSFHQYLNDLDNPVKLTLNYHIDSIEFLDLNIRRDQNRLVTCLFRKTTDRNSILHASSNHPPATIRGIPYSQFLRTIRNNSTPDVAVVQLREMFIRFKERGYPDGILEQQLQRALQHTQDDLLTRQKETKKDPPLIFTTTFTAASTQLSRNIQKHWPMINQDDSLSLYLSNKPLMGYRRDSSLRDMLVRTDFKNQNKDPTDWLSAHKKLGCYRCPDCVTCRCLLSGPDFPHPHTGRRIKIKHRLSCTSSYVVYIITCPCGLYYVGKTVNMLKERIGNHRSAISKALKEGTSIQPVARHFAQQRHPLPTFKCMAIDQQLPLSRGGNRDLALLRRESRWIHTLDCVAPRGLNEMLPLGCFS
uniref:Reverse transcriptase domain-containing protein n=1 Tax=Xenopus tropicalis TaxID=8364 RepID=A0A803J8T0_XENTR